MGEVVQFPDGAITNIERLPTDVLVKMFHEWDGMECDARGIYMVHGYSVLAIQNEVISARALDQKASHSFTTQNS